MNRFELRRLRKFCDEHGLDPQLIDDSLTFSENIKALEQWTIGDMDLIEAKALQEWYNAQSYAATYVVPEEAGIIPPQFHRAVIHFRSRRRAVRFDRTKWGQPISHGGNVHPKKVIFHSLLKLPKLITFIMWIVPDVKVIEKVHYRTRNGRPIHDGYLTLMATYEDIQRTLAILEKYGSLRIVNVNHVYDSRVQYIPDRGYVLRPEIVKELQVRGGKWTVVP